MRLAYDELRADRDQWRAVARENEKTAREALAHSRELAGALSRMVNNGDVSVALLRSLRAAADDTTNAGSSVNSNSGGPDPDPRKGSLL